MLGSGPLALTPLNYVFAMSGKPCSSKDTQLGWRNGRRVRLRGAWGNLWGFESPPEHHLFSETQEIGGIIHALWRTKRLVRASAMILMVNGIHLPPETIYMINDWLGFAP